MPEHFMHKDAALHIDSNLQRQKNLCRNLKHLGLEVHKVSTSEQGKEMITRRQYRLVLIHSQAIKKDIIDLCSFIRTGCSYSIIIVMMGKPKIQTEEKLFDCGVNDVVTGKQAANRVLTKRIKAHLSNIKCPSLLLQNNSVRLKDTIVDFKRREVLCNGKIRELTGILGDLLKYFIDNRKRAISRDELLNSPIWSDSICSSATDGGKTFDVNIGKLRKIIEPDPSKPQIIISVRGVGWKLAPDVAEQIEKG